MEHFSADAPENGEGLDDDCADEALSLSDLPLIHQSRIRVGDAEEVRSLQHFETLQDFDFCALSTDSEMCAADEVFFRGQILPLRCSIGSGDGSVSSPSIPRSRSMDSRDSIPSRSSSISSRQSSSSCGSVDKPLKPPANPFHSHPSPSPKLQQQKKLHQQINNHQKCTNKSLFRLRLIATPPKIEFQNPKTRTNCRNRSGRTVGGEKKAKTNFLSGCDCKLDAVDTVHTVPSKLAFVKRSASDGETVEPKKRVSENRTFEWLKQLSIEGTPEEM